MLDELRDGGEACSFKAVLTLRGETVRNGQQSVEMVGTLSNVPLTHISILDYEMSPLVIRKHRQDIFAWLPVAFPHQEVPLLSQ